VATLMLIATDQACEGRLAVADPRMRKKQRPEPTSGPGNLVYHAEAGVIVFYAARFRAAHLFFIASLIRLRAAGDKWRLTPPLDRAGRPGPRFRPCKAKIAALRRSRSASNSSMIVAVSMLLLGENECPHCTCANKALGADLALKASASRKHLAADLNHEVKQHCCRA
jgi:hypothetical protein